MGEPAGVGPDIIVQVFANRKDLNAPDFIVFGNAAFLQARANRLEQSISLTTDLSDTSGHKLKIVDLGDTIPDTPGMLNSAASQTVIDSISEAVKAIGAGQCSALVTAPIQKSSLYEVGFRYPGHTEFLAALATPQGGPAPRPVMMLAHEGYRTVPLTIHVPLRDVPGLVTRELILETLEIIDHDLKQRFDITSPRIAVTGLNPHAGEDGTIGTEDRDVIIPALEELRKKGLELVGPLPADTMFFPAHWKQYDCILAMYHDQALIPIKTIAFDAGVNVTLGLPFVRTSPDHGTALSLAGTGKATCSSFLAALRLAEQMARAQ